MNWNYIAGFFDGEGSITKNGKGYRITISQTNFKVLNSIKNFLGFGNIFKEKKRKEHWKDSWVFYIAKQDEVLLFLKKIRFLIIVKEKEVARAIKDLNKIVRKINKKKEKSLYIKVKAKKLRDEGMTYREIGNELGIDFGHARRLALK